MITLLFFVAGLGMAITYLKTRPFPASYVEGKGDAALLPALCLLALVTLLGVILDLAVVTL